MFTVREQYYLAYSLLREMYAGRVCLRDTCWDYLSESCRAAAIAAILSPKILFDPDDYPDD